MIKVYKTNARINDTKKINTMAVDSWIDLVNPTNEEIEIVSKKTKISTELMNKMLDADELPRVEIDKNAKLIVIDTPVINEERKYDTYPLGIIITNNYIVTISTKKIKFLDDFKKSTKNFSTGKKSRFLIQLILKSTSKYISILNEVNKDIKRKEKELVKSTKNKDITDLLSIEKTLVYFITSLKENSAVLERLRKGNIIQLYEGDLDLLEDAVIEINQAIDMSTIYRDILSSITDTYATIISNNLNNMMKFLAGVTIVLSIPTMISSFLGMNVKLGIIGNNPYSAWAILGLSIILSILVAIWLKKKDML